MRKNSLQEITTLDRLLGRFEKNTPGQGGLAVYRSTMYTVHTPFDPGSNSKMTLEPKFMAHKRSISIREHEQQR